MGRFVFAALIVVRGLVALGADDLNAELERARKLYGAAWQVGEGNPAPCAWVHSVTRVGDALEIDFRVVDGAGPRRSILVLAASTPVSAVADTLVIQVSRLLDHTPRKEPLVARGTYQPKVVSPAPVESPWRLSAGSQVFVNPRRRDDNPAGVYLRGEYKHDLTLSTVVEAGYMTSSRRLGADDDATTRAFPVGLLLVAEWPSAPPYHFGVGGGLGLVPLTLKYEVENSEDRDEVEERERQLLLTGRLEVFGGFELGRGVSMNARVGAMVHRDDARISTGDSSGVNLWRSPMLLLGVQVRWALGAAR